MQAQLVLVGLETPSDATADMTAEQYQESLEELLKTDLGATYAYTTVSAATAKAPHPASCSGA